MSCNHLFARRRDGVRCVYCNVIEFGRDLTTEERADLRRVTQSPFAPREPKTTDTKHCETCGQSCEMPRMCPHEYFDIKDCVRCTPPADGSCIWCGTFGDHYCPHWVDKGEEYVNGTNS